MIIIGEQINATRKSIAAALEARDEAVIVKAAQSQAAAGAHYLDVNGGDPREGQEARNMEWLIDLVQANTDLPVAVDSANPQAVELGLSKAKKKPILNSVSLEKDRLDGLLPVVSKFDCMVVALLMSDGGTPCGIDDRMANSEQLIKHLTAAGKKIDEIIVDPCFLPVSADAASGRAVIDAIAAIRARWPEIHIGGGCSNISFGLPKRRYVNFALLSQAIYHGMDTGLIDPCVPDIMATILAAEAVAGRDEFCMNYVMGMR
ncbi:MAG: dihydropteroate synthase [Planctomycetes bacterium]|jgi:cobalamin-dependent methionine synthase I|nr:dihydropteroate synthase [Planctomycetota bacterium]